MKNKNVRCVLQEEARLEGYSEDEPKPTKTGGSA